MDRPLQNTTVGRYIYDQVIQIVMRRTRTVEHNGVSLTLSMPNIQNYYRVSTFSTKEPETLEWIDGIPENSVLWDIGANVGLYTCYAAKARGCRVYAFEPSVFNLELLARNIFLNDLVDRVTIVPLPLSAELSTSTLNMTSTEWGGAMSTFGEDYGHDGELMTKIFAFPTVGLSMTDAAELLKIAQPDYITMDVDGIEHLILKGGKPILGKVKGVLIEINDEFAAQANDASTYLKQAGFTLQAKKHADYFDTVSTAARHTFNQIWIR
jgi:FkbM family methyltransferase